MSDSRALGIAQPAALAVESGSTTDALAAAFRHAMIGIAIGGPDGHLRDANPALLHMLGYERDDLLTLHIADITHADDHEGDAAQWALLASGEVDAYQREKRYLRNDGSILWGLVTVSALRDESGTFLGSSAQIQDITAQKAAEAALRENEAQLEALVEQLPVVLYSQPWRGSHAVRYVSPRFEQLTGLGRDDISTNQRDHHARIHPEDRARVQTIDEWADRTGETARVEYRMLGGNGEWVWVDHRSVLMRDEQGQPVAWHGSIIDISERKHLEASLRESDVRFRRAFEDSAIGMAIGTPDDICLDANDAYCQIVGVPREELIGNSFKAVTYPQDREDQDRRLAQLIAGEADSFVVEKRYLRPDGEVVTGLVTISAVRDDTGALLYCVGQILDISAQKATEVALSESEELLRSIIERVPAAVYRLDPGIPGSFTFASPHFETLTGLSIDDHITKDSDFFARVHPDDLQLLRDADNESARTGEPFEAEYRIRGADGSWVWLHDRSIPARDEQGKITAWHGILLDISEQKRLQADIKERDARLQSLIEHLPVALYSVEPDPDISYSYTSPQFESLTGMTPEDIARGTIALDDRVHPDDLAASNEAFVGVLAPGAMWEAEYRVLNANGEWRWVHDRATLVCDDAGNPMAWNGVLLDISERKQLQAALRENEERLQVLVGQLPAALFSLEPENTTQYAYVSPQFEALTGMSPEDVARGTVALFERMHPDDIERVREEDRRRMASGQANEIEYRVRHADGEWVWLQERAMLARDARGRPMAWHGVLLDISEQRRLEGSLRDSEARFRSTFEGAGVGMALCDPECRVLIANPALERLLGFSQGELDGCDSDLLSHPDDLPRHAVYRQRMQSGDIDSYELEKRYARKDGEYVWVILNVTAIRDDRGALRSVIGQLQDITARKAAEEALRESEARFRSTFEGAAIGMSLASPDGLFLLANPALERLLGYGPGELAGVPSDDITYPDDRGDQAILRERLRSGEIETYQFEKRFVRTDGEIVWAALNATAIRDDRGKLQSVIGQILDITARKAAEEALRESEARFRSSFEGAGIGMSLADLHGRFFDANPAFCEFLGYTRDELLKLTYLDITHPDDREHSLDYTRRLFKEGFLGFSVEKRYVRADGRTVWGHLTITTVRDPDGKPYYEIAQVQDITARKATEEALRESEARFRSTFERAGTGMTLVDLHGRFLDANPAFCQFVGYSRDELLKLTSLDVTLPEDRPVSVESLHAIGDRQVDSFSTEKRYLRPDGRTVWGHLTATALPDPDGRVEMMIGQIQDITARKEAEAAQRESEARFQSIFEDAGIGMAITTPRGKVDLVNPAMALFLGYSPNELIGVQIQDLTFPDDVDAQDDFRRRTRVGEIDAYLMEKRYVRKDGDIVWGLLNVSTIRDDDGEIQTLIGQVQDITARKEAESALRESEARFRALVQNDPDVIGVVDEAMTVVYVSPSAQAAFGVAPEEILGPIDSQVFRAHPEDIERTIALFAEVAGRHGAVASTETRIKHVRQGWRWFQVMVANLLEDPGVSGYLFKFRDITERKRAEIATASALKTQQTAIAELERLNRSKSRFLSTISHEFRTPLTAIIGYSEFMINNAANPALIAEDAEVIHREASRLNRMVDDVLLLDRADARRVSLTVKPLDFNAIVLDVAETFRPLIDRHRLVLDLDPALRSVDGDGDRLAQALTNLVSNAVKYSPDGGTVEIATRNEESGVLISVRDEGIGILAEDFSRIFDRFERVETGIAGRIAGTGLGLSIVQEIVSLHGGNVWVESEPGFGSTFFISLPTRESGS